MKYLFGVLGLLVFVVAMSVSQNTELRENSIISFVSLLKNSTVNASKDQQPSPILLNEYITLSNTFGSDDSNSSSDSNGFPSSNLQREIISYIADKYRELELTPEQASKMIDMVKALNVLYN